MRAARLLQMLLLLQNRGRMTARQLATELEVARRTIHRDVDAMTEAGLPIIVHQGQGGGIELGFNYRTRLTGLDPDEAEALGLLLAHPMPELDALGLGTAASRARAKLVESLPDGPRRHARRAQSLFRIEGGEAADDPRIPALAKAVRGARIVRINARSNAPRRIHPAALIATPEGWSVVDAQAPDQPIPLSDCGDLNISAKTFRP
ncbi:MAG: HTH domain-containing protein [Pseudomonadota bacterium]